MEVLLKVLFLVGLVYLMTKLFPSKAAKINKNLPIMPIEGVGGWLLFFMIIFSLLAVTQFLTAALDLGMTTKTDIDIVFYAYFNTVLEFFFKTAPHTAEATQALIPIIPATNIFDINEAIPSYLRTRATIGAIGAFIGAVAMFILGFRQKHSTIKVVIALIAIGRAGAMLLQAILPYMTDIPASRASFDSTLALRQAVFTLCLVGLFAAYMLKSKRVRNTYLKPGESPPRPIMPQPQNSNNK